MHRARAPATRRRAPRAARRPLRRRSGTPGNGDAQDGGAQRGARAVVGVLGRGERAGGRRWCASTSRSISRASRSRATTATRRRSVPAPLLPVRAGDARADAGAAAGNGLGRGDGRARQHRHQPARRVGRDAAQGHVQRRARVHREDDRARTRRPTSRSSGWTSRRRIWWRRGSAIRTSSTWASGCWRWAARWASIRPSRPGIVSGLGKVGRHVQMSGGRVRQLHPDRRQDQPGQLGRAAGQPVGRGGRHQHADQHGPGRRVRVRDPDQPGAAWSPTSLLKEGRVRYAYMGVLVGDIDSAGPESEGAPGPGVEQRRVRQSGDARRPGRQGRAAAGRRDHRAGRAQDRRGGRRHRLRLDAARSARASPSAWCAAGKPQKVAVELGELPSVDGRAGAPAPEAGDRAADADAASWRSRWASSADARGAVVAEVAPGGPAAAAGVREGDVILEVDRQRVTTAEEAAAALAAPRSGGHLVRIRGASGTRFITLGGD